MQALFAFAAGLLFGLGLLVSGMTSPERVLGFLDLLGAWDPSLAFVMGGAVMTALPFFWIAQRRAQPILGGRYDRPDTRRIDRQLILGSALFGAGWGLVGICPGPAIVNLVLAPAATLPFLIAMIAGTVLSARVRARGSA